MGGCWFSFFLSPLSFSLSLFLFSHQRTRSQPSESRYGNCFHKPSAKRGAWFYSGHTFPTCLFVCLKRNSRPHRSNRSDTKWLNGTLGSHGSSAMQQRERPNDQNTGSEGVSAQSRNVTVDCGLWTLEVEGEEEEEEDD